MTKLRERTFRMSWAYNVTSSRASLLHVSPLRLVWTEIGYESLRRWTADPSSTLTSWNGWWDIAAESDLIDGVVPGDRLTGVFHFYGGSLNSWASK